MQPSQFELDKLKALNGEIDPPIKRYKSLTTGFECMVVRENADTIYVKFDGRSDERDFRVEYFEKYFNPIPE